MNEKHKNILLAILLIGVVGYCYYAFYLKGEITKISDYRRDIAKMQSQIKMLNSKKSTVDYEIQTAKAQGASLNEKLPDVYDKKAMILHFYNLFKNGGVSADKITFSDSEKAIQEYRTVTVSFKVQGDASTISSLIKKVENDEMKFVIKQLSISQGDGGINSLSLTVEFYTLK